MNTMFFFKNLESYSNLTVNNRVYLAFNYLYRPSPMTEQLIIRVITGDRGQAKGPNCNSGRFSEVKIAIGTGKSGRISE